MEYSHQLINLYTTLFVITITNVGILLASMIALTQLLEPFLVSKSAQKLIRPASLKLSAIFLILTLGFTLTPMTLLSMGSHDFVQSFDFNVNNIFLSQTYIAVSVALLVASATLVAFFIYRVSRYLVPVNALSFLRKYQKADVIIGYFQKSGAKRPTQPFKVMTFIEEEKEVLNITQEEERDVTEEKKYKAELKKYETDKIKLNKTENPLFPLEAYLTRAIQRGNLTTVVNTLKTFEGIITDLLSNHKLVESDSLIQYYRNVLENANELAQSIGLQSMSLELLSSSSRMADMLLEKKKFSSLSIMLDYWQTIAKEYMMSSPVIFKRTVSIIGEVAENTLRNKKLKWDEFEAYMDNVCRALGWLGEELLKRGKPEKKALMLNDYETELGVLMNAVMGIGWDFHTKRADAYPLIFFDSLYVISKKLAPYIETEDEYDDESGNHLFSLMYELYSFGEAAIRAGNVNGASLALLRLEDHIKIAESIGNTKHKQYVLEQIFRLGALAAGEELKGVANFLHTREGGNLDDIAIGLLQKFKGDHDLENEAHEILIKSSTNENWEKIHNFLVKASKKVGTSFGMNLTKQEPEDDE